MNDKLPKLSNPRTEAVIDDWPSGNQRCRAWFQVEAKRGRGERVTRRTENKDLTRRNPTPWNTPKATTYASRCAIVDGNDGRTYILEDRPGGRCVTVRQGDMKYAAATVFADTDPERYAILCRLITERTTSLEAAEG